MGFRQWCIQRCLVPKGESEVLVKAVHGEVLYLRLISDFICNVFRASLTAVFWVFCVEFLILVVKIGDNKFFINEIVQILSKITEHKLNDTNYLKWSKSIRSIYALLIRTIT